MSHSTSSIQNPNYPRYDRYKDSGVEWLGEVPSNWEVVRAKRVFKNVAEKGYPNESLLSATQDKGVIPRDLLEQRVVMPIGQLQTFKLVRRDDFVISLRSFQGGIEHSAYRGLVSPAYTVLRLNRKDASPGFLRHLLKASTFISELNVSVTGIRQGKNIDFAEFAESFLPLPPKPEQDRIVAFLDRKTAEIDALIAKKQRQIELLDEQKAILIHRAVTRGIVNSEFGMRNEHLSSSSHSTFTTHNSKFSPSGIEWIGEIPEHWEVKKLRWLLKSSVKNGVSPPISEKGQVPTLSIAAVKNGQVTFGENVKFTAIHKSEATSYLLREGDILALRGNGSRHLVATAGIVGPDLPEGCIYPDLLIRIQPANQIAPQYLVMQLNGVLRDGINLTAKTSAGIWKVSGESLSALQVLLPPHDEQMKILEYANFVQERTAVCKSGFSREIQSLQTLRSAIIARSVTGAIKV
jgi:type I restriction enzyme S subunit